MPLTSISTLGRAFKLAFSGVSEFGVHRTAATGLTPNSDSLCTLFCSALLCVPVRTFARGLKHRISGGRWLQQLDEIRHRNSECGY
jgi:hypothetical protein